MTFYHSEEAPIYDRYTIRPRISSNNFCFLCHAIGYSTIAKCYNTMVLYYYRNDKGAKIIPTRTHTGCMDDETTTIQVSEETWKQLNRQKGPGDTFDDVIQELLQESADE